MTIFKIETENSWENEKDVLFLTRELAEQYVKGYNERLLDTRKDALSITEQIVLDRLPTSYKEELLCPLTWFK